MVYQNKKPSFISLLYIVAFFVFLSCVFAILSSSQSYIVDTWQNYATFDFEQGTETDENGQEVLVNYISTPEQLAGAFQLMNNSAVLAYDHKSISTLSSNVYKLNSNINLSGKSWTPVNLPSGYIFDGCYYSISNLYICLYSYQLGFISRNNGTIQNLIFTDLSVKNNTKNGEPTETGGVCGQNHGIVQNVIVMSGSVCGSVFKDNSDRIVGGICGLNTGTICFCTNYANVKQGKHMGGIVGKADNGQIKNCYNYGNVWEPGANEYPRMGGIVGETYCRVSLCLNFGKVNCQCKFYGVDLYKYDIQDVRVGGIAGCSFAQISECGNYGEISGGQGWYHDNNGNYTYQNDCLESSFGGIVGYINADVTDCFNRGDVSACARSNTEKLLLQYDETNGFTNTECYDEYAQEEKLGEFQDNDGIYIVYNQWRKNYYYFNKSTKGNTDQSVGRIISYKNAYAGGIVGNISNKDYKVLECYNMGEISGGKRTYEDTYVYSIYYTQDFYTLSPLGWYTHYYETSARIYYNTIKYTYEFYYSPIIGTVGGEVKDDSLSLNVGLYSYNKSNDFTYKSSYYYYHEKDFRPVTVLLTTPGTLGFGLNLYALVTDGGSKVSSKSTNGTTSGEETVKIDDDDNSLFSVAYIHDVRQFFKVDCENNKVYVKAQFKLEDRNDNYKQNSTERVITKDDYVKINQIYPAIHKYGVCSNNELSDRSIVLDCYLGDEYWDIDPVTIDPKTGKETPRINDGYPYLKNMYW